MDPDVALFQLRELAASTIGPGWDTSAVNAYGFQLAEAVQALDEWLTKGGFAPREWKTVNTPSQEVSAT